MLRVRAKGASPVLAAGTNGDGGRFPRHARFIHPHPPRLPNTRTEPNWLAGAAFINKQLFSSYSLNPPPPPPPQDPAAAGTGAGAGAQEHAEGGDNDDGDDYVEFSISLAVLLECLQIFGGAEASSSRERWHGANGGGQGGGGGSGPGSSTSNSRGPGAVFDQTVLRIGGTCRFSYRGQGHPLHLTYVAKRERKKRKKEKAPRFNPA